MGRFDRLPGIDEENTTRRNVLVGSGYTLGGLVVLGAVFGDPDDDDDPGENGADDTDDTDDGADDTNGADDTTDDADDTDPEEVDDDDDEPDDTDDEDTGPELTTAESVRVADDLYDGGSETFTGTGDGVEEVSLGGAFTVFSFDHSGESNFAIEVLDENGDMVELVVNEIGAIEGANGFGVPNGEYTLDITADGDWTVQVGQPLPPEEDIEQIPVEMGGDTHDVYGAIQFDGLVTVSAKHEGESNFAVVVWDEDATEFPEDILVNEIGEYDGETTLDYSGVGYVVVTADGDHEITIE